MEWIFEYWYVFAILGVFIGLMFLIAGCMEASSFASREEERLYDKLVSGEEYKQTHQEHGDK